MLRTPSWITGEMVETSGDVRWEAFEEGRCVPSHHVGPDDAEGPVLEQMHQEVIPGQECDDPDGFRWEVPRF